VTLSPFLYQLPELGWERLLSREFHERLAWVALPTVLFLAARFLCRQLAWMQLIVAVVAAVLAVFLAGLWSYELSHSSGNRSSYGLTTGYLALLVAPVPALMVLLLAVLVAVRRWFHGLSIQRGERREE
jgi:hypothetical protein